MFPFLQIVYLYLVPLHKSLAFTHIQYLFNAILEYYQLYPSIIYTDHLKCIIIKIKDKSGIESKIDKIGRIPPIVNIAQN